MIARRHAGAALRQLRTLYNLGAIGDLTDGQLLERFATDRPELAELAFSALLERHEAMVWRACLAILRDEHQAEDAFQATFLVLVGKARTLWVRDSLGPWLHQVACRTASCLRAAAARRIRHERRHAEIDGAHSGGLAPSRDLDLDTSIEEAVDRLPEKYRAPLVLCDLEGRTHREAARCLGWPIGTVKSRQSQGRKLVRDHLIRRGLAPAAALAGSLTHAAFARPPMAASRGIVAAAMRGSGTTSTSLVVSSSVHHLARGVLRTMIWIKFRSFAAAALALAIATGGAGVYVRGSQEPASKAGGSVDAGPAEADGEGPTPTAVPPRADHRARRFATRRARAVYEIARHTRELAELNVEEYAAEGYPQDLKTAEGEIQLARSDLERIRDRLAWSAKMFEKGYVSEATRRSDELSFERSRSDLERAEEALKVLVGYTRDKRLKELRLEVDRARRDERSKKSALDLEVAKETRLDRQLVPETK